MNMGASGVAPSFAAIYGGKLIKKKTLYDIGDPSIYIGTASMGVASSSAAWLIKKITLSSGTPVSTLWSGNTAIWDNRASEVYS